MVAGRLSGAFRRIGRSDLSDEILKSMKGAGYNVRETDPFEPGQTFGKAHSVVTPIVGRLHALWKIYREVIVDWSPDPPGLPKDPQGYLRTVDDLYRRDAYHSLSIEGYAVTPQLIDRVRAGQWDPDSHSTDHRNWDALAARGYWQAFQLVRASISEVITGDNACRAIHSKHRDWNRQLFEPCVNADLMDASMLAGYRNTAVYLRGSRHIPPGWQVVRDAMPAFFHLLERETDPFVQAVLGHWLFGYIHPFPDGNGRVARFVMNVLLASGGYPWTVIHKDERDTYMAALESASVGQDIEPFARFVARKMT